MLSIDDKKLAKKFKRLAKAGKAPRKIMMVYLTGSVLRNFHQGGRPKRWKKLADSTVASRRHGGNVPLRDTGHLMNSIHGELVGRDNFKVTTRVHYAPYQHYGASKFKIGAFTHPGIPARPFMMYQAKDPKMLAHLWQKSLLQKGRRALR